MGGARPSGREVKKRTPPRRRADPTPADVSALFDVAWRRRRPPPPPSAKPGLLWTASVYTALGVVLTNEAKRQNLAAQVAGLDGHTVTWRAARWHRDVTFLAPYVSEALTAIGLPASLGDHRSEGVKIIVGLLGLAGFDATPAAVERVLRKSRGKPPKNHLPRQKGQKVRGHPRH